MRTAEQKLGNGVGNVKEKTRAFNSKKRNTASVLFRRAVYHYVMLSTGQFRVRLVFNGESCQ